MIKVVLVDDEIAIREGIRNSFPWEESGYTLVGEAPDGEIALPIIRDERPDILITDIRMPFMDGMELCREVRRTMPWIGIVILSGHDDFSYARQAISLGVQEYLLKPITARELREVLDRISDRLREERRARESADSLRKRLAAGDRFVRDKLLQSLFTEVMDEGDSARMIQQLRSLGINMAAKCYTAMEISFTAAAGRQDALMSALYALAGRSGGSVQVCPSRRGARALILGDGEPDAEERAYAFASSACYELETGGAREILIAIGSTVFALSDIPSSMKSAQHIRGVVARRGGGMRIVGEREMEDVPSSRSALDFSPLHERLQYTDSDAFEKVFDEYAASLSATDVHATVTWDYLRMEAMLTAANIVRSAGGVPESVLNLKEYEAEISAETDREDLTSARELLRSAIRYRETHGPMRGGSSVARARAFLAQHFTDPNLMLQDAAQAVGMSNSRFSTVFSQETGYTFTEYLTSLRMSKAKELLKATTMRSSQICAEVGYSDPHYFSYLFKKHTGVSPSEYRRQENEIQPK